MKHTNSLKCVQKRACSPHHSWTLELSMMLASTSALLAAIILMVLHDNKPLAKWSFPLSFNTVISILGATSRASLAFVIGSCISQGKWNWFRRRVDAIIVFDRFDDASRGPWGSIRLLYWIKFRHWIALGALCTVILLGFEPLLQAGITLYDKEVDSTETAAVAQIGRSRRLDVGRVALGRNPGQITIPAGNFRIQELDIQYDFQPLAAMWTGFSNLSSIENKKPSFTCSTGNCTWPAYASVAVCNSCADISDRILRSTGRSLLEESDEENITMPFVYTGFSVGNTTAAFTKYEIGELGMNISNYDAWEEVQYLPSRANTTLTAKATSSPGDTISFRDFKTLLLSFGIMQSSQDFRDGRISWQDASVTAQECALYFCTNIYQSVVNNGVLSEEVLESHAIRNLDSFTALDPDTSESFKEFNEYFNYTLNFGALGVLRSDLQMTIPEESVLSRAGDDNGALRFNVSQNAIVTLTSLFMNRFARRPHPLALKQLVYPDIDIQRQQQPSVILSLGTSPNITSTFDNVAAIMSKWIRDGVSQEARIQGSARVWIPHIQIKWPFMTLPAIVFLTALVFCLLSLLETRKLGLQPWKGSSLATLAVGLDSDVQSRLKGGETSPLMNKYVRETKVQLTDSIQGPELITVKTVE
ncbi:hypothetical protein B0I35DRAFT_437558 [Stachybotrys elegans]|uniref:Uncharacterized protein n=1 Tax=Stachybotrys elegans TaxID=80388 RepID=A0A8K0SLB4_9HYPO|nr:hypothetical protein B0I35DRAFT_437558 [Stachybotrys elegans]